MIRESKFGSEHAGNLWKPNALLLGPGGVKGFLMLGSLLLFEKSKMLKDIKKIVGVSMGAIIGLFLNIGCSVTEILETALMTELSELITNIDVITIMRKNGLVSHDIFRKRMQEKVIEKYGFVPTLKQLYTMTGCELDIVVTNLDKDLPEYFNYQTEPDLSCVEAVIMSMSLPLFFYTYVYKENIYLDGGIADPFPIHRFGNENVLAIRMMGSPLDPKDSFFNYIAKVVSCLTSQKRHFKNVSKNNKILDLEYEVNDAIGVKMTFEKRVEMVLIGYLRAYNFLESFESSYLGTIEKYTNPSFFNSILIAKSYIPKNNLTTGNNNIQSGSGSEDSDVMEEEGDAYLEECFDSDSFDEISTSEQSYESNEPDEEESEREREQSQEESQEESQQSCKVGESEKENEIDVGLTSTVEQDSLSFATCDDFERLQKIYQEKNVSALDFHSDEETDQDKGYVFINNKWNKSQRYRNKQNKNL